MHCPLAVLVHGAWHGAWCFAPLQAELTVRGFRSLAVDLPGNGLDAGSLASLTATALSPEEFATEPSPVSHVTLDQQAEALAGLLHRLHEAGEGPVVLVAHSMGGHVATRVAEEVPHRIAALVYLSAFMPASGVPAAAYITSQENAGEEVGPLLRADPEEVGALRINPRSPDPDERSAIVSAFAGTVEPDSHDAWLHLLTTDLPIGVPTQATRTTTPRWGSVPRTYIRCLRDRAILPSLQTHMIREADAVTPDNRTRVTDLDTCHSPFLADPAGLADVLTEEIDRSEPA